MTKSIEQVMLDCLNLRDMETAPAWVLSMKLGEEFGEFCEAALKEMGYLQHKVLKEDTFGEAADIINVVLAALQKLHPNMSNEEILAILVEAVDKKRAKYEAILKGQR